MADNKKAFILYADQQELFNQLSDEMAGKLIKHIFKYVNDENPKTDDIIINLAFTPIKQQLKRDLEKWRKRAENSRVNGAKGGRPPKNPKNPMGYIETQKNPDEPRKPDTVNDTVTVKDTDTVTGNVKDKDTVKDNKKDFPEINSGSKKNISKELFNAIKKDFMDYYKYLSGIEYYYTGKDAGKIKPLILKIKKSYQSSGVDAPTDKQIEDGFKHLIKLAVTDEWIKSNFSLSILDSKYNEIILKKNGKPNKTQSAIDAVRAKIQNGTFGQH